MKEIGRQFEAAVALGFRAVKMEVLFDDLVTDRELVDLIKRGRKMLGDDIQMAVDFGYRWHNWHDALWLLDRVKDCDILFAEATLQHDDLDGHAELAARSGIRIGGAEAAATRFEIREWLTRGKVGVVQPNIGRGGWLDRDPPHRRSLRAAWRRSRAAWLEDGNYLGRRPATSTPPARPRRSSNTSRQRSSIACCGASWSRRSRR